MATQDKYTQQPCLRNLLCPVGNPGRPFLKGNGGVVNLESVGGRLGGVEGGKLQLACIV